MEYGRKLQDPRWQRRRLEIMKRDNFQCCYCSDCNTELQIHHLKYTGEPWEAPEKDLVTLCAHCHDLIEYFKNKNITVPLPYIKRHSVNGDGTYRFLVRYEKEVGISIGVHLVTKDFGSKDYKWDTYTKKNLIEFLSLCD